MISKVLRLWISSCLFWTAVLQATFAVAQAPSGTVAPVILPDSQQWIMHGDATGRDYLVQVSVPDAPPPADGYPVLYVLDGNARFPLAVIGRDSLTLRRPDGGTSPWLIVGIGYPDTRRFNGAARSEDYTPAVLNTPAIDSRGRPVGGAQRFQVFLHDQVLPRIAARFDVDSSRRSLLGHSYGGLFALYTALTRPSLFSDYIAISPSLWWGNGFLCELPPAPSGVKARVLLGASAQEQGRKPAFAQTSGSRSDSLPAMCGDIACFSQWLESHHRDWTVEHHTFTGVSHGNVMWPAMRALWRFLNGGQLDKSEQ